MSSSIGYRVGLAVAIALTLLMASPPVEAQAAAPADASRSCRDASGLWDAACLRAQYREVPLRWPTPTIDPGVRWSEWSAVPSASAPPETWTASNPGQSQLNADLRQPAIVTLGAVLFADPRLSANGKIACASCHQPEHAFSDGRALAVGADGLMGRRRSMPLFAAPFAPVLFWDGRAASLHEQVLGPIADPREMNHDLASARARLADLADYRALLQAAYGDAQVSDARIARGLAAFVATLRPPETRFDRFLAGDTTALDDREMIGLHLFRTEARCMHCHQGALLTDGQLHNIGLSFVGRRNQDLGRYEVTRAPEDIGRFRTPSLRGVSRAGPFMHNGIFPTLVGVVRMYNAGMPSGRVPAGTTLTARKSPLIQPLNLSPDEIDALVAFLGTL